MAKDPQAVTEFHLSSVSVLTKKSRELQDFFVTCGC